jgi:hypothetical protein
MNPPRTKPFRLRHTATGGMTRTSPLAAESRKIGFCGPAPSDYPAFAQFLVDQRIDSNSQPRYWVEDNAGNFWTKNNGRELEEKGRATDRLRLPTKN